MNNKYQIIKEKCDICGRTYKRIIDKERDNGSFIRKMNDKKICMDCDRKYRITGGYSGRGYGYKYSTSPHFTVMDRPATPTYGIEIEVAGNISNIDKISKLTERCDGTTECSIGYDTSVEGAMFELSYAPGTYYWLLYESNLSGVCKLLQKDEWTIENSPTIGMHIHIGNIDLSDTMARLRSAARMDTAFWRILRIAAERDYNQYCKPIFARGHHDAISRSTRWRTMEFRIFNGTYDFNKIMKRVKFIRQLVDNTTENGVNWKNFSGDIKDWLIECMSNSSTITEEEKKDMLELLEGTIERSNMPMLECVRRWEEEADREYYGDEERDDEEEEGEERSSSWF